MSAIVAGGPRLAPDAARKRRHRVWMYLGAIAAIALTLGLAVHGAAYYVRGSGERVLSPRHGELNPGGSLGIALGIAGTALLLMIYLYPLRKRWRWLAMKGKTKNWLDYHILMGLTAPAVITFHSAFKFRGVAGLAYWSMMAVVASGIVGRYLYARIPRRLGEAELSLDEARAMQAALTDRLESQQVISREELAPLLALPSKEDVKRMPLLRAVTAMLALDFRRTWYTWRLRRRTHRHVADHAALKQVLALASRQASLSNDVLFLSKVRELFRLWHVVHRPFSYSLAILAIVHIFVVTFLGYF